MSMSRLTKDNLEANPLKDLIDSLHLVVARA